MEKRRQKYLRTYAIWEQNNEQELYEVILKFEEVLFSIKKYSNIFIYFVNLISKKILKYAFLFLRSLFLDVNLKRHISPNQIAENVALNYNDRFRF